MTEWCTTRSIAAAVAMGLAKMRSHSEKTRFDVMPNAAFGDQGEEDLRFLEAQVVEEQEVEVVQLAQLAGQVQIALGGEEFLHQTVGRSEEYGVAGFHQAVAQGAERVGLAGAGQSEGQHVDAALHKAALGQLVQLLPQRQGDSVVLEGFPGLARG